MRSEGSDAWLYPFLELFNICCRWPRETRMRLLNQYSDIGAKSKCPAGLSQTIVRQEVELRHWHRPFGARTHLRRHDSPSKSSAGGCAPGASVEDLVVRYVSDLGEEIDFEKAPGGPVALHQRSYPRYNQIRMRSMFSRSCWSI
jgi:hypothetical protein